MSFDNWWKENAIAMMCEEDEAKLMYDLGASSRQCEVDELKQALNSALQATKNVCVERDELQNRIDDLLESVDWHIEDCDFWLVLNKNDYWKGGQREILKAIKKKLKGNQND